MSSLFKNYSLSGINSNPAVIRSPTEMSSVVVMYSLAGMCTLQPSHNMQP